ncbi:MAG: hypothetical protein J6W38_01965, partial [Prevotella sp.]|nr:hypothetical protein [Prevotella sp.]
MNQIIIFLIQNIQFCRMGIFSRFKIFRFVSNHYFQITKNIPIIFWEYILDSKNLDLNQGIIFSDLFVSYLNKKVYLCTHETTDIFVDAPVWDDDSIGAGLTDRRTIDC